MADNSLSNPFDYTICLTGDEYKKHQRLIYTGSIMSQLLSENYFHVHSLNPLSYSAALHEIARFLDCGQKYSALWNELASALYKINGY